MGFAFGCAVSKKWFPKFPNYSLLASFCQGSIPIMKNIFPLGFYDLPVSQTFGNARNPNITMPNKP